MGASNLTNGLAHVVAGAEQLLGEPVEVWAALGHGRSFGQRSQVLARALPGIRESGLWPALSLAPPKPCYALITDLGNDLMYGVSPGRLLDWIDSILEELVAMNARITLDTLPLASLQRVGPGRYFWASRLLFPFHPRIPHPEIMKRIVEVEIGLRQRAKRLGVAVVEPRAAWYGIDPIHIRRRYRSHAWAEKLGPWTDPPPSPGFRITPSAEQRQRVWRARAECRWMFGKFLRVRQPCVRFGNGTTVSLY